MFGGAVDEKDPAFAEARWKRAKKEEEEDEKDFKEAGKIEVAVFGRHRRPYGMGQHAEAGEVVDLKNTAGEGGSIGGGEGCQG